MIATKNVAKGGTDEKMQLYHDSQNEEYRFPKGAVKTDDEVRLLIKVISEIVPDSVKVRLWTKSENFVKMELSRRDGQELWYSVRLKMPGEAQLLWYFFEVETNGKKLFYSNNQRQLGGVGVMEETPSFRSYQITVYDKDFHTPDWFKNVVLYQIFPDRFFRLGNEKDFPKRHSDYRIHDDWYEDYFFDRHPFEDGPACNDFYGGNLKGIMSKLDYLKDLGIGAIYLNPIFEAFSNHRYDTGDYSQIDGILGTNEDFAELCKKAEERGIRIILDGVFSHTGSDSIYFNKYKSYGENVGAAQNDSSPYSKWYTQNDDGTYSSWWGCSNLVNVNELEPTYIDYILKGSNAIIKKWLKSGASGWRLDVADELPDEFIKILRNEAKAEKADSVIIGEVWEDASNKISYGQKRQYFGGHELDGVMNYVFRDGVLKFLLGEKSAEDFKAEVCSLIENYPKEALLSSINLIGSHDTCRAKTVLSGKIPERSLSQTQKSEFSIKGADETLALRRLRLAVFMQMTFIGVPCIYYGDEIGMQGLDDPFNRRPYTWRSVDPQIFNWHKKLVELRNNLTCLRTGELEFLYSKDGVIAYERRDPDQTAICVVNRNDSPCEIEFCIAKGDGNGFKQLAGSGEFGKNGLTINIRLKEYGCILLVQGGGKNGKSEE
ncbi:MAG: glycoside hydrolase family 13 protein [Clostridia bacterium]|nr:glycoside hydrolase family 13 protein [Clostridia bacterium]